MFRAAFQFPRVLLLMLSISVGLPAVSSADEKLYEQSLQATVWIIAADSSDTSATYEGTGILVNSSPARVLTNYHVVTTHDIVLVCFPQFDSSGKLITDRDYYEKNHRKFTMRGRTVRRDSRHDLALIEIEDSIGSHTPVQLASNSADRSEIVGKIGNSSDEHGDMFGFMAGQVIDVRREKIQFKTGQRLDTKIVEVRVCALPGDSGGPLLNDKGQLVGLVSCSPVDATAFHHSIDITEIRAFLRIDAKKPSLTGGRRSPFERSPLPTTTETTPPSDKVVAPAA